VVTATADVRLGYMDEGMAERPVVRRFTVDEAIRMVEAGIVGEDEHVELLGGALVDVDATTDEPVIRRFTGEEGVRLVEAGILGEDEHVELLDGAFVEMSPQSSQHSAALRRLSKRVRGAYGGRAEIFEQLPLAASEHDVPEPDLAVVRPREDDYSRSHPTGRDAILVVEIALSSQRVDRRKSSIYAKAGVETYWVIDLPASKLHLCAAPAHGTYQVRRSLAEGDEVQLPETRERWEVGALLRDLSR
jgi:Uma2 family endonuclease